MKWRTFLVLLLSLQMSLSGCTFVIASWRNEAEYDEKPRQESRVGPVRWEILSHDIPSVDPPQLQLQLQARQLHEHREIVRRRKSSEPEPMALILGSALNLALVPLGIWLDESIKPAPMEDPEFFTVIAILLMLADMTAAMLFLEDTNEVIEHKHAPWQAGEWTIPKALSRKQVRVSAPDSDWSVIVPVEQNQITLPLQNMPSKVMGRDPLELHFQGLADSDFSLSLDDLTLIRFRQAFREYIAIEPARLNWSLHFVDANGDGQLEGEESAEVLLQVHNQGPGKAYQLELHLDSAQRESLVAFPPKLALGNLPAGETQNLRIPLKAVHDPAAQQLDLQLQLRELNGFDPPPKHLLFQTAPYRKPALYLADYVIEDQSGNGEVEPLEIATITARLHNRGTGAAEAIRVRLKLPDNLFLTADSTRQLEIQSLPAGAFKDIRFQIYTNPRARKDLKIQLEIEEKHGRYAENGEVQIALYQPLRKAETIRIPTQVKQQPQTPEAPEMGSEIAQNLPLAAQSLPEAVAVIIGNRDYRNAPGVEYALRDAALMRRYLIQVLGYQDANILYYPNATKADLDTLFGTPQHPRGKIHNWLKPKSPVFLYYTGHGAPGLNGERYLVPVDANLDYLPQTGYALKNLYQNMASVPYSELTVVIDACFSGFSPRGTLFPGRSPLVLEATGPDPAPLGKALVINSTGQNQLSHWYDAKRHSLFTYYFLKGLQGAADLNRDRQLTDGELQQYLSQNIPYMARRLNGGEQEPVFWRQAPRIMARYAH